MSIWPAVITLGGTILIQIVSMVYFHGRLTEKVSNHDSTLSRHENKLDDHEKRLRIVETGDALGQLAEWVREIHGRER